MSLYERLEFTLSSSKGDSDHFDVAARFAPADSGATTLDPLWTDMVRVNKSTALTGEVTLTRLRPNTRYTLELFVVEMHRGSAASLEYSETFHTSSTGFPSFDDGAFVTVTGSIPNVEVVSFATTKDGGGAEGLDRTFTGLLAVDAEGYIVWCVATRASCARPATAAARGAGRARLTSVARPPLALLPLRCDAPGSP
jgi:hypothetical protein